MFRNFRINIFIYYFLTVNAFLAILHYFLAVVEVQNIFILAIVMICFSILGGVMISKLAIDPLQEYIESLQNMSKETLHELNLPISTIITNSQMLQKNIQNTKDLKRLSRIQSACGMLEERYNELDYMIKKQTSHKIKEKFSLDELVKKRVNFLKNIYPQVEFILELEKKDIFSDITGLSKVIDNIVDNGVKYAPNSNKYEIRLKDNTLSFKDYGCGMDEVELVRIFDNYYQSDKNIQGFGIGLSMVKRFCDTQDIELNFKSKLNYGTTVLLKFKDN